MSRNLTKNSITEGERARLLNKLMLRATVDHDTGCIIWGGEVDPRGNAIVWAVRWSMRLQSAIFLAHGVDMPSYSHRTTCGRRNCLNKDHLIPAPVYTLRDMPLVIGVTPSGLDLLLSSLVKRIYLARRDNEPNAEDVIEMCEDMIEQLMEAKG